MEFRLEAHEVASAARWRWVLTGPTARSWQSAALAENMRGRGATAPQLARSRINDSAALAELGHCDEALALLSDCRRVQRRRGRTQPAGR